MLLDGRNEFQDYLDQYPKYTKYSDNAIAKEIFVLMSEMDNIHQMILTSDQDKPALTACIEEIENRYGSQKVFDLSDDFTKQALGAMVKTILEPFGYVPVKQKRISKDLSKFVSSASVYMLNHNKQRIEISQTLRIGKIISSIEYEREDKGYNAYDEEGKKILRAAAAIVDKMGNHFSIDEFKTLYTLLEEFSHSEVYLLSMIEEKIKLLEK